MNNDPVYQRLREIGWRRKLTPAEAAELRAWLAAHPKAAAEQELESALNHALHRLPDAPVPSNFTARVRQAIEREELLPSTRPRDRAWVWRVLLPRTAAALVLAGLGAAFAYQQHRVQQRVVIGDSIVAVVGVPTLPGPDILADFDVIRRLNSDAVADSELLALLQ